MLISRYTDEVLLVELHELPGTLKFPTSINYANNTEMIKTKTKFENMSYSSDDFEVEKVHNCETNL